MDYSFCRKPSHGSASAAVFSDSTLHVHSFSVFLLVTCCSPLDCREDWLFFSIVAFKQS